MSEEMGRTGEPNVVTARVSRYFLDVGVWGRGSYLCRVPVPRRTFGLVCEHVVLLCEWDLQDQCKLLQLPHVPQAIRSFLENGRARIVKWRVDARLFTGKNEVIVFIPDLHLHLFREEKCDNFTYGDGSKLRSLEKELDALLQDVRGRRWTVVQVGDLFEMWESQFRFIDGLLNLKKAILAPTVDLYAKYFRTWRTWFVDIPDVVKALVGSAEAGRLYGPESPAIAGHASRQELGRVYEQLKTAICDSDNLRRAICSRYPALFGRESSAGGSSSGPFDMWVAGNHDNMLPNAYWVKVQNEPDFLIKGAREEKGVSGLLLGNNECIRVEHGHRKDPYNADGLFDKAKAGYYWARLAADTVADFIAGELGLGDLTPYQWELLKDMGLFGKKLDRRPGSAGVKLVVMGHSHEPRLYDYERVDLLARGDSVSVSEFEKRHGKNFDEDLLPPRRSHRPSMLGER